MPEIQNSGSQEADRLSAILAGYLTPKNLAQALGVSERTVARWHRFREGPPRVEIGRKVFYRLESVNAWIASCERPEARADRVRRRPRLRAVEPSSVAVPMQRNHLGALSGPSGSND
jgi:predicted DNA-binding transcriptional regulator AlpA